MTSGQPLLASSESSPVVQNNPLTQNFGSFSCHSRNGSFSWFNDAKNDLIDEKEDHVISLGDSCFSENNLKCSASLSEKRQCCSVVSRFSQQFPFEYPTQEGKLLVSWGTMDLCSINSNSTSFELTSVQEKLSNPHRIHHKSGQFEDNLYHEENPRLIYISDPRRTNEKYEFTGNEIRTSKYTLMTFLPKNLFIQFHRLAYLYFLAIAALNQLPPLAVFGRTVSLFPLLFVLCVTAIKDGYEDWRRHRSDRKENNREALVLQSGEFQLKKWEKIRAGEVVKIRVGETIPCDIVLLGTSDPSGLAYIQTMNLDGESNLKTRYARQETALAIAEGCSISGLIRCEQPNRNIYEFTANMEFKGHKFPLNQSNIVLRGCQLKNTEWIIGVVVYAGQETKAMLNSAVSPSKRSKLEGYMNRETLWLSVFLFVMCLVVSIGMGLWLIRHNDRLDTLPYYRKLYFSTGNDYSKTYKYYGIPREIFFSFLSSVIVFQIMIPISLYITMELVRLGQSYFMIEDKDMYDSSSGSRFQCRSLNINEDLGQIRYVFSDKTGTLTENKMEFRRASVYGKDFGNSVIVADPSKLDDISASLGKKRWKLKYDVPVDLELLKLLHIDITGAAKRAAQEFFLTLAACNTVIPIITDYHCSDANNGSQEDAECIDYQGESPDEQALVIAASAYGYTLFERTSGHIGIDINGVKQRFDVLGLHEFDSVRKRMSVVIRYPDNVVKVLVKGADTTMLNILANDSEINDDVRSGTQRDLNDYSSQGLRTLIVACRDLTDAELEHWQCLYEDASTSLTDRALKLRQTAAIIECDLKLLGATAIEDKLQDGVPDTIESLRQAGIKVWVLTGDKQETAISIGLSCKLLTADMQRIVINGTSENDCRILLTQAMEKCGLKSLDRSKQNLKWRTNSENDYSQVLGIAKSAAVAQCCTMKEGMVNAPLALIIDGNSLVYILEKDLESELFDLATSCRVVLCCRVAPLQKAGIVDLIKSRTDDMTLAIGDGANDVSMIQMADVGVGICGQEGRQAVMASDFAMGQFHFLKRLLLVHGHWNYQRIGYMILYNFYRNAVFVLMLFWYILCTAFSTTSALTDWSSVFYSVIYTSIPTIFVGILDKNLSHKTLLKYPKLYGAGHRQEAYNLHLFWITMIDTLWQSLVLFYIPLFTYKESSIDIWSMGSLWTIAVVVLVNVHLAMDVHRWVLITHIAVWGSIVITYACMVVLDSIPIFPNYWSVSELAVHLLAFLDGTIIFYMLLNDGRTIFNLVKSPTYWLTIFLIIVVALLPRFTVKIVHQSFWPSDIQIAREAEILKKGRDCLDSKRDQSPS